MTEGKGRDDFGENALGNNIPFEVDFAAFCTQAQGA